jgi:hypothetical protein
METRKQEHSTNFSESTSMSQEMFSQGGSKQLEKYHSGEDIDKIRE